MLEEEAEEGCQSSWGWLGWVGVNLYTYRQTQPLFFSNIYISGPCLEEGVKEVGEPALSAQHVGGVHVRQVGPGEEVLC